MNVAAEDPTYRDNSNDALFGSVLVIEATLRALVEHLGAQVTPEERDRFIDRIIELLGAHTFVTRYGTGHQVILEGVTTSFSSILNAKTSVLFDVQKNTSALGEFASRQSFGRSIL